MNRGTWSRTSPRRLASGARPCRSRPWCAGAYQQGRPRTCRSGSTGWRTPVARPCWWSLPTRRRPGCSSGSATRGTGGRPCWPSARRGSWLPSLMRPCCCRLRTRSSWTWLDTSSGPRRLPDLPSSRPRVDRWRGAAGHSAEPPRRLRLGPSRVRTGEWLRQDRDMTSPAPPPPSVPEMPDPPDMPRWEQRFRAPRVSLPRWAWDAPDACVLRSNASGTSEIYAWSPGTSPRQLTHRTNGTWLHDISLDGRLVWWFADTDGDEFGVWTVQHFDGTSFGRPAAPSMAPGYPSGLALGRDGTAYIGRSDDDGTEIWRHGPLAEAPVRIYASVEDANVTDVDLDGDLICIEHAEHGDNRHPALRVVRPDGTPIADLWDGPGLGLSAAGF